MIFCQDLLLFFQALSLTIIQFHALAKVSCDTEFFRVFLFSEFLGKIGSFWDFISRPNLALIYVFLRGRFFSTILSRFFRTKVLFLLWNVSKQDVPLGFDWIPCFVLSAVAIDLFRHRCLWIVIHCSSGFFHRYPWISLKGDAVSNSIV